ncbi:hypothetical protein BCR42DRAFT_138126 [Absidia repens]|uniref:Uncharacterized protein n=1 Tax=Absidia repens TaxID=90262 RepID=A0A1X2IWX5_9FUNG|nr:hypothetical protein BCR42DRAFT_138126 [Absidia repens]
MTQMKSLLLAFLVICCIIINADVVSLEKRSKYEKNTVILDTYLIAHSFAIFFFFFGLFFCFPLYII